MENNSRNTFMKKFRVDLVESERGWGQRTDSTKEFDSLKDANEFVKSFNSQNTEASVPDWYMYASSPYEVFVEEKYE